MEEKKVLSKKMVVCSGIAVAVLLLVLTAVYCISQRETPEQKIARLLDLGQQYLLGEDYEQVIATFDEVLAIDPYNVDANLGKVEIYLAEGDGLQALKFLQEAYGNNVDERYLSKCKEILTPCIEAIVGIDQYQVMGRALKDWSYENIAAFIRDNGEYSFTGDENTGARFYDNVAGMVDLGVIGNADYGASLKDFEGEFYLSSYFIGETQQISLSGNNSELISACPLLDSNISDFLATYAYGIKEGSHFGFADGESLGYEDGWLEYVKGDKRWVIFSENGIVKTLWIETEGVVIPDIEFEENMIDDEVVTQQVTDSLGENDTVSISDTDIVEEQATADIAAIQAQFESEMNQILNTAQQHEWEVSSNNRSNTGVFFHFTAPDNVAYVEVSASFDNEGIHYEKRCEFHDMNQAFADDYYFGERLYSFEDVISALSRL